MPKYISFLSFFFFCISQFSFAQKQPNVLFIISDDLNTNIGPYLDVENHTPNLDKLAKSGVRFTRAYSQFPLCGPSRASLMSGLYPESNGIIGNAKFVGSYRKATPSLSNHPSIAGFFRENGYFTARVSKIFHMGVPGGIEKGEAGDDDPDSWDYTYNVLAPETQSPGNLELLSPQNLHFGSNFSRLILDDELEGGQADYIATSQAIAILESRAGKVYPSATNLQKDKDDKPFFLAVGLVRPHTPFIAPENCFNNYPDDESVVPKSGDLSNLPQETTQFRNAQGWGMNEEEMKKTISGYMASVRFMDQQVGRLLESLERLNLRDETIVVFISDHGYNLGEHDSWSKRSLWEGSIRVPMIFSVPGNEANNHAKRQDIVELIDLYPTFLDLAGFKNKPSILQGTSFAKQILNTKLETTCDAAYTITNSGNAFSIRTDEFRYSRWGNDVGENNEQLYNHKKDPEELNNLAQNKKYKKELAKLRLLLSEKRANASIVIETSQLNE